ncbi:WXG100 family type VII secretion target [Streptomyces sp. CBMA123]|uniref:WXG100 family type VII secretion target n=1 Tax=Streptomyces sp. CBMA123 TaxID=1896313 RepID=UPI001661BA55|nr:hypothetical protein [Streptomyces sp. CBMA123]
MVYTDFTKYSHADLRTMAQALDPGAVMAAGDPWRKAATTLKEIRKTLTNASTEAATSWDGTSSDSFHTAMLTLAGNINEAAAYANDAANTLHNMSEAMAKAKRDMPEEPGNWDQIKDKVGDFFSTEDDHIQITDRKKAEAAEVMQTLAMHYRIATPALKAPSLPTHKVYEKKPGDSGSQDDPSNAAAAVTAAVFSGTSFGPGLTPARSAAVTTPQRSKSLRAPTAAGSTPKSVVSPTDSGIKGGTAQAPPKPSTTANRGTDAGISGNPVARPSGSMPSPGTAVTQTSALSSGPSPAVMNGPNGVGGQTSYGAVGPMVQSTPVGPGPGQNRSGPGGKEPSGGMTPVEGSAPRGGRVIGGGGEVHPGNGVGGGTLARPGGAIREVIPPGAGARGKAAFTEGGSGLGARNRLGIEPAARGTGVMAPGVPMSETQRRKNRGKDGKRPDYLVEDEETWAPDKPTNPNVVE